ncbi:pyridoxamine 5'-phosphate oxidase family protein [Microbacterium sp. KUDC0406]|uniref:pyridoxamine 5'-phosphate oxidase family protein n=1 Tax=Microbacterium sp. KUDC0406 TaxID=2909588 RepID=UPI001F1AA86C|nr:pyridoxamine 5'-phosphate oxidase family protein [Microbacterium sp. KUDC0406]UJP08831.1 pyridoxamine 5'-phosphate oxidase family protein [Microbacterium sp. KUDC0406]
MIRVLDEDQCFSLMASTTVARIGFLHDGRMEIIPVNFLVRDRLLTFRVSEDGILASLPEQPDVAFEVDHLDDLAGAAWSVLMSGRVEPIDPSEVNSGDAARTRPWAGGTRELWLRFVPERVSGRSVRRDYD